MGKAFDRYGDYTGEDDEYGNNIDKKNKPVTERPILMSTPMVQSTMKKIKRMTRRTKGLDLFNKEPDKWYFSHDRGDGYYFFKNPDYEAGGNVMNPIVVKCPYGRVGDVLWVRETWAQWQFPEKGPFSYAYKADGFIERYGAWEKDTPKKFHDVERVEKWKPSIFMPREACRIRLEITDIRIERLNDITEKDAEAEGAPAIECGPVGCCYCGFIELWRTINGKDSWELNPWVWVISFKIIDRGRTY